MAKIFLSYRRQDSAGVAGRIYDRLRAHFGDGAVFVDIDNIPFGVDFREHIDSAVGQCDVVVAVIGRHWAGETNADRRIDDPRDFVRIEIESALKRDIPVIPILIDRTSMPTEAELPSSIAGLTYRNAIEMDLGRDFNHHVERLVQGIDFHLKRTTPAAASPLSQPQDTPPSLQVGKEVERSSKETNSTIFGLALDNTGMIPSELRPEESLSRNQQVPAAPTGPPAASRNRPNIFHPWLYAAAPSFLAFLGVVIYIVTVNGTGKIGTVKITETNKQSESPNQSGGEQTKLASSETNVRSPELVPPQSGREWTNSIGMKFVRIDAGSFLMGTTNEQVDQVRRLFPASKHENFDDEQPRHPVKLSRPFSLGVHEVTRGQYQEVMHNNPGKLEGSDDLPVESVSWLDAIKFCNELSEREKRTPFYRNDGSELNVSGGNGYRLPTEAEWEYACRAGSTTLYPFGDEPSKLGDYAWFTGNAESKTHLVGQQFPNAWGLYDMLGNLGEWCADGYLAEYYASSSPADPRGSAEASHRVIRGGSWGSGPAFCRSAYRSSRAPANPYGYLGFRVAAFQK